MIPPLMSLQKPYNIRKYPRKFLDLNERLLIYRIDFLISIIKLKANFYYNYINS